MMKMVHEGGFHYPCAFCDFCGLQIKKGGIACERVLDLGRDMMELMRECETNHSFFLPRRH